ncbi:MAG: hypothetical protein MOGMAGMI_02309 [Candidatus Omnitrophica bacterium]|nr:hypothetical protein [Candidatus Omnitrophota bacterium]
MGDRPSKKKKRTLTPKAQKLVAALKQDPSNIAAAGRAAGYKDRQSAYKTLQKTEVKEIVDAFAQAFTKAIPDETLISKHKKLLNAKKVVSAVITGKDADEKDHDFIEVDDCAVQLKALDMAYKVRDKYPRPENFEAPAGSIYAENVQIVYGDPNNSTAKANILLSPLRERPYDPQTPGKVPGS